MNTYYLTFTGSDNPCDGEEYVNLDDAYDMADYYSEQNKQSVNIYENDAIISVIRNF
jgi:hypothetical protein